MSDRVDDVIDSGAELGVVVAFGRLIKPHVLDAVPMVNLHFSLLPRWRGAAPVEWSILSGDTVTGAAVMALEAGLDTGPVYAVEETEIDPDESADELRRRLAETGTALLVRLLDEGLPEPDAPGGRGHLRPQAGARGPPPRLDPAGDAAPPGRPPRPGLDDVPRQAATGPPQPARSRASWRPPRSTPPPSGSAPATAPSNWSRCSPRARDPSRRRPGATAPACSPATASGPDAYDPFAVKAKVLTVSDGVIAGTRDDRSGAALVGRLEAAGYDVVEHRAVADGTDSVAAALSELADGFAGLVVTTGGTGFGPRDLTPEGTDAVLERRAPGLAEAMRLANPAKGRLSRGAAGTIGACLILNTPGSTAGAVECLEAVLDVLPHALELLAGQPTRHP